MPLDLRTLSIAVVTCALAACADSTGPAAPRATVTVPARSVAASTVAAGNATWIRFTVPLQIENTGSVPLTFAYCASRVEARAGHVWASAWRPDCTLIEVVPVVIAPGERRDLTVSVQAALDGQSGPPWSATPGATEFRFVAGLIAPSTNGSIPTLPSNTFVLKTGT